MAGAQEFDSAACFRHTGSAATALACTSCNAAVTWVRYSDGHCLKNQLERTEQRYLSWQMAFDNSMSGRTLQGCSQ